jgi:hypothetical protein
MNGKFEKHFNATFVALIPQKVGVMEIKDFHPIRFVSRRTLWGGSVEMHLKGGGGGGGGYF